VSKKRSPAYPTLSKAERKAATAFITDHLNHVDDHAGGHGHAVATGLRQAAPHKYDAWCAKRAKGQGDGDD
jgi:hypothetical protein